MPSSKPTFILAGLGLDYSRERFRSGLNVLLILHVIAVIRAVTLTPR